MITTPEWPSHQSTLPVDEFLDQAPEKLHFIADDRLRIPAGTCFLPAQLFSLALSGFGLLIGVPLMLAGGATLVGIARDLLSDAVGWRDVALQGALAAGLGGIGAIAVGGIGLCLVQHLRHLRGRYKVGLYLLDSHIAWRDEQGMVCTLPRQRLERVVLSPIVRHESPRDGTWLRHRITLELVEGEPWTMVFDQSLPSWLALRRVTLWLKDHRVETD